MLDRRLARPMLAAVFVAGGADALRAPEPKARLAEPVASYLARRLPAPLPEDAVTLVRLDGAVKVAAGLALATSRFPRLAAVVLGASLVPTTLAGHPFWQESDPAARKQHQQHFLKNVGLLGGLVLAAVGTAGPPSPGRPARRAARYSAQG